MANKRHKKILGYVHSNTGTLRYQCHVLNAYSYCFSLVDIVGRLKVVYVAIFYLAFV